MKSRFILCILITSFAAASRALAADQVATVTEAVNIVDHGSSQSTASTPATKGTQLHNGDYLKTGASSRAELQFANSTISRLGSNTIFNYNAAANEVDLQAGTILFSKPKDGQQINIKTEAVTAAIVGTTGFVQVFHHNGRPYTVFGIIEGNAHVTPTGGADPGVGSGEFGIFSPGGSNNIYHYDLPAFIGSSGLYNEFKNFLPPGKQQEINAAIDHYHHLFSEGFLGPLKGPFSLNGDLTLPPQFVFPKSFDSAGNGHQDFNGDGLVTPAITQQNECYRERCCREECRPKKCCRDNGS